MKSDFKAASRGELSMGIRVDIELGLRRATVMATFAPLGLERDVLDRGKGEDACFDF